MIEIKVNGDSHKIVQGTDLVSFLVSIGIQSKKVAVELNREIIPKSHYQNTILNENDVIEIVHFIGGG